MWILFFILITSPGQYRVEVLETYNTPTAQTDCKSRAEDINSNLKKTYKTVRDQDTYFTFCLKQPEIET